MRIWEEAVVAVFVKVLSQQQPDGLRNAMLISKPILVPAIPRTSLGQHHCTELMDDYVFDVVHFGNLVSRIFWQDVNYQSL